MDGFNMLTPNLLSGLRTRGIRAAVHVPLDEIHRVFIEEGGHLLEDMFDHRRVTKVEDELVAAFQPRR